VSLGGSIEMEYDIKVQLILQVVTMDECPEHRRKRTGAVMVKPQSNKSKQRMRRGEAKSR